MLETSSTPPLKTHKVNLKSYAVIPKTALFVLERLRQKNYPTYIVGGWVRDHLIHLTTAKPAKHPPKKNTVNNPTAFFQHLQKNDLDFTTQAHPETVMKLFPGTIPTGIKHGTVTVRPENDAGAHDAYEVTTFRKEGKYSDHRRPGEVSYAVTLAEDLIRRDFTINAFAYDPTTDEVIDLFNGLQDLELGIIRVISSGHESRENRFKEDALRMMRACRFAGQLGFTIEPETLAAINSCAPLIKHISPERIRDELIKLVIGPAASTGLEYLRTTGLMEWVLPELQNAYGVGQNSFHAFDVYYHSLKVLEKINELQAAEHTEHKAVNHTLALAALFHDLGKPITKSIVTDKIINNEPHVTFYRHELVGEKMTVEILRRLKFPNKDILKIAHLVRQHMFHYTPDWKDGTVRRFVAKIGKDLLPDLFLLRKADRLGKGDVPKANLEEYFEKNHDLTELLERIDILSANELYLTVADLKINGAELISALGIKPGKPIGVILHELLERVLDDPTLNEPKTLLKLAQVIHRNLNLKN